MSASLYAGRGRGLNPLGMLYLTAAVDRVGPQHGMGFAVVSVIYSDEISGFDPLWTSQLGLGWCCEQDLRGSAHRSRCP